MKKSDRSGCFTAIAYFWGITFAVGILGQIAMGISTLAETNPVAAFLIAAAVVSAVVFVIYRRFNRSSIVLPAPAPEKPSGKLIRRIPTPEGRYKSYENQYQYCPKCGVQNPLALWYCLECGAHMEAPYIRKRFVPDHYAEWLAPMYRTHYQRIRFDRAKYQRLDIINHVDDAYLVRSSDGERQYIIGPDGCTCQDFGNRCLPCKHMYAAMIDMQIIGSDYYMFRMPRRIKDSVDGLAAASDDAAIYYRDFLSDYGSLPGIIFYPSSGAFFPFIPMAADLGLIESVPTDAVLLIEYVNHQYTVPAFRQRVAELCPDLHLPSSLRKADLIEFALSQSDALSDRFAAEFAAVRVPPEICGNAAEIVDLVRELYS